VKIIIFEDSFHDNFYPLSVTRPVWELRSGNYTVRERLEIFIHSYMPKSLGIYYFTREYLVPFYRKKYPELSINNFNVFEENSEFFFINASVCPEKKLFQIDDKCIITDGEVPVAARFSSEVFKSEKKSVTGMLKQAEALGIKSFDLKRDFSSIRRFKYIWDFISLNSEMIREDFNMSRDNEDCAENNKSVTIIGDRTQLYTGKGVRIDPFVVVDVTDGPVYIDDDAEIHSFSRIEGPAYIGEKSVILGAKVREGTSIGDCCRIGGEIEESIFQGYSNKYHDGFIGHSYVGEWVNLGAMTANSDLKNNYSNIRVYLPEEKVDTGMSKAGCFIGDFAKASIGTLFNTGSSIGPGAMLVHSGVMTPAHVPPFSWFINSEVIEKDWLAKFIEMSGVVCSRRNVDFTKEYSDLIKEIYAMTSCLRK